MLCKIDKSITWSLQTIKQRHLIAAAYNVWYFRVHWKLHPFNIMFNLKRKKKTIFKAWAAILNVSIYNSTTIIPNIKEMLRSLFYDIICYVTMDYRKWFTSLLLTQMKNSVHLKFKIMSITCRFHFSNVVMTLYTSY